MAHWTDSACGSYAKCLRFVMITLMKATKVVVLQWSVGMAK